MQNPDVTTGSGTCAHDDNYADVYGVAARPFRPCRGRFLCSRKGSWGRRGLLLAERTRLSPEAEAIEAMTFRELAATAHSMIALGDRGICPLCAHNPAVRCRDAVLPCGFWRPIHGRRRRPLGGEVICPVRRGALIELDALARQVAGRLADGAAGRPGGMTPRRRFPISWRSQALRIGGRRRPICASGRACHSRRAVLIAASSSSRSLARRSWPSPPNTIGSRRHSPSPYGPA